MADETADQQRSIGLLAATGVGVGAIVGGGIFVLAGVAFENAGPAAAVAFALNGVVAFLTAMSFAEVSTAFPESGGAYTFAKKVLSMRTAFAVGWILWFAYIVAGVLYALGFASFAELALRELWVAATGEAPAWVSGRRMSLLLATLATVIYAGSLIRKATGGGQWATVGKLVVFGILVLAGIVAVFRQPTAATTGNFSPFFHGGASGIFVTMGFTFIALQGFDLIAAVGGEVKNPGRTIPRAMFYSLGAALVVYIPLLLLIAGVGIDPGDSIVAVARAQGEEVIALAARRFLGTAGYWLVIIAAILSTLSALHANIFAASRVALTMARDRTLPTLLGDVHQQRRTPVMAIYATALTLVAIVFMIPNLAAAGAASSLIFLISFALAHVTTYLARRRGGTDTAGYRTPWFPAIPVVGGLACASMAVYQALSVPDAGGIVFIWLGLGVMLYWSVFARRAEIGDAASEGLDPTLVSLRGHSPLVLVPIANPAQAAALVGVANALAARKVGRVLLLSIVPSGKDHDPSTVVQQTLDSAQAAVGQALRLSLDSGYEPNALMTISSEPMEEIARIAEVHRCEALLLGLGELTDTSGSAIENLINRVDADVALMKAPNGWRLRQAERVLVPVGGRGDQHELRARLLGTLTRARQRVVTFMTVVPQSATDVDVDRAREAIGRLADLKLRGKADVEVVRSDDATGTILAAAEDFDLLVLGLASAGWRRKTLGAFATRIASDCPCAALFLSRRRPRAFELLEPLRDDVVDAVKDAWNSPLRKA